MINGRLVSIDKMTGACTVLKTGSYPNSLAFVPVGTVLPDCEALVGYVNDSYVQINPDTGLVSPVGNLNAVAAANPWMSSGDIVSIVGGGNATSLSFPGERDRRPGPAIASPRSTPRPAPSSA